MSDSDLNQELMRRMRERIPANMTMPPPVFTEMGGSFVSFDEAARVIRVRFPVEARYQNPGGTMQGGVIAAAIDNTVGPLSYLVGPPSVTTQMNLTYVRPISPPMQSYTIEARVVEQTRRFLYMSARVESEDGRLLVLANVTQMVVDLPAT